MRRQFAFATLLVLCLLLINAPVAAATQDLSATNLSESPPSRPGPTSSHTLQHTTDAASMSGVATSENNTTLQRDQYDGGDQEDQHSSSPQTIAVDKTISQTPGTVGEVTVEYTAHIPDNVVRLEVYLNRSLRLPFRVTSASNIQYNSSSDYWVVTSPRGETTQASLTYTIDTNVSAGNNQYEYAETSDWAFIGQPHLFIAHSWSYFDSEPSFAESNSVSGEGLAGDGYVYLGQIDTYAQSANGQQFTLGIPKSVSGGLSPQQYFDTLATGSTNLTVGARDPAVSVFIVTDPIIRGGQAIGDSFRVHQDSGRSVILHEYTHTRQNWIETADIEWLTEAMADYYQGYLAWEAGYAAWDDAQFQDYLDEDTSTYADSVLQDSDSDSTELKNYYKGRRVLGALDIRIRQHTNGEATLADVLAALNQHNESEISYSDFRQEAIAVTNESTGAWLDEYVTTPAAPPIPTDIAAAYAQETSETEPQASVTIADQTTDGTAVSVERANLSAGGFVTIHDGSLLDGATFDSMRGTSTYLSAGMHTDIQVSLAQPYDADGTAIAIPYRDTNGNEQYDFVSSDGATDQPYTDSQGNIITSSAQITVKDIDLRGPESITVSPGGTATVTYTVANTGTSDFASLLLSPTTTPTGITVQSVEAPEAATIDDSTAFFTDLTAGSAYNATVTYNISENVTAGGSLGAQTETNSGATTTVSVPVRIETSVVGEYDANGDGKIDSRELLDALADYGDGVSPQDLLKLLAVYAD